MSKHLVLPGMQHEYRLLTPCLDMRMCEVAANMSAVLIVLSSAGDGREVGRLATASRNDPVQPVEQARPRPQEHHHPGRYSRYGSHAVSLFLYGSQHSATFHSLTSSALYCFTVYRSTSIFIQLNWYFIQCVTSLIDNP